MRKWANEWMNERTKKWMIVSDEWTTEWMSEWMIEQMSFLMFGTDPWKNQNFNLTPNEWINKWMDGWMNE